jgi:hypothetical protein
MVQRYAHLSPGHLAAAVEKIVAVPAVSAPGVVELGLSLDSAAPNALGEGEKYAASFDSIDTEGWPSPVEGVRLEIG